MFISARRPRHKRLVAALAATYHPRKHFRLGQDIGWHWQFDDPNTLYRRRNLLTYTGGSYASPWATDNSGATNPTVTANYAQAPDGTMTAARVQLNKTGGVFSRLRCVVAWPTGRQYVVSVYARTTSGSGTANVGLRGGDAGGTNIAVSGAWQRFTYPLGTLTVSADFQLLLWDSIAGNDETADILIWGAQLELGPVATEYQDVPTTWPQAYLDAVGAERIFAWTDTAGTIPVTAIGDGIGLLLGREYGGARGAELCAYSSGFPNTTGITVVSSSVALVGSALEVTSAGTAGGNYALIPVVTGITVGKVYEVRMRVRRGAQGTQQAVAVFTFATITARAVTNSGTFTEISWRVTATATSGSMRLYAADAAGAVGDSVLAETISIREIPGTHLTQATGTAKPTLSARVNLLLSTEGIAGSASWLTTNTTKTDGIAGAPDGTATATRLVMGGLETDRLQFVATNPAGVGASVSCHHSIWVKSESGGLSIRLGEAGALDTIAITTAWTRIAATKTATTTVFTLRNEAGGGAKSLLVWHPDLRTADDAAKNIPAYQRVGATATDHDTDGFPHFALADGTDDCWASVATVDGSAHDKISFVVAVTKNSDAASGTPLEFGPAVSSTNGSFGTRSSNTTGTTSDSYSVELRGTSGRQWRGTNGFAAPVTSVVAPTLDLSSNTAYSGLSFTVNGVSPTFVGIDNAAPGGGTFSVQTLYVLARAGTITRFNGRFYGSTGRFGPMSNSERNNLTRWWQKRIGTA